MVRTSRKSSPIGPCSSGARGSTSAAPRRRHASSAASKPVATSGSSSTSPIRGETATRTPSRLVAASAEGRAVERALGTPAVGAGHRVEQENAVGDRPRHRASVVEAPGERHDARERDEPPGRLDRRRAAARGGDPERARRVGAGRRGRHPRGERSRGAAARPAGRSPQVPRAADLVGRPADRELVRVQVAEQHHARGGQPGPGVAVLRRHLLEEPARRGHRLAGDAVEVLEPDRHARQRRGRPVPAHGGVAQALVRARGGLERVLLVDAHPGVDRARVARRGCASPSTSRIRSSSAAGHLPGGELAPLQVGRQLRDAQPGDVRHDGSRKRRGLSIVSSSICASVTPSLAQHAGGSRGEVEVVGPLVGEVRVADHEVHEARGVVREVDAVAVALLEQGEQRPDPVLVGVEVGDVEAVEAEHRARVADRPQVRRGRCCRLRARRRCAGGSTPRLVSSSSASVPVAARAFVCTITGAPVSSRGDRHRVEDPRDVADDAVLLDGALEERRPDAGVVDSLADLADEQLGDRLGAAVVEEVRQLEERVDAGSDDDVQVDLGVDALDARDAAAEARGGRIDERPDTRPRAPRGASRSRRGHGRPRPSSSRPTRARSSGAPRAGG